MLPPHDPARFATTDSQGFDEEDGTNGSRAESAASHTTYPFHEAADFSDLITNLIHLAHSKGYDPEAILHMVNRDFPQEAGPLPEQEPVIIPIPPISPMSPIEPIAAATEARRQQILDLAMSHYANEEVVFDEDATLSEGNDNGCYLSAWAWVDFANTPLDKEATAECQDCEAAVPKDDPYFATPCGTFCEVCMRKHIKSCGICRQQFADEDDFDDDDDTCTRCHAPTDDGEGYDGLCGNCADKEESTKS